MDIDAHTSLNLVIGNPIKHSQSPALHAKLYAQLGINARMLAIENPNLSELVSSIKALNIQLIAVTLPFKTEILKHADVLSDSVHALGAANTLIYHNGMLHAHNTDVDGIKSALKNINLTDKNILILGAGGAARAVGYVLQHSGASLFWFNRTRSNAELMANQFGGSVINFPSHIKSQLIINATPLGMSPNIDQTPLPDYNFHSDQIVFDLIYTPRETRLLREASQAGAHCILGETMFKAQALKQIELCYGVIA